MKDCSISFSEWPEEILVQRGNQSQKKSSVLGPYDLVTWSYDPADILVLQSSVVENNPCTVFGKPYRRIIAGSSKMLGQGYLQQRSNQV